ncbi:hypothetical protein KZZ52_33860 [Dactylosporangium sp. AC04546]|uniref:hypothetical protein n=1 Tax=Dactylosporangium sp. AC04546 TaxID=2862460 RepID=UPI001EDD6155|nr:hypothetical protein [Dactylosporangium sp. AC04546]WVK78962.1 hypothetical protein KZZ52_33860 [Dactylosporangium sp. AC04546]
MTGFVVQPDRITAAGRTLGGDGRDLLDRLDRFEAAIGTHEGAWGDDTIGTYIGAAYTAIADWALTCWATAADELIAAGEDVESMGEEYQRVEDDNAQRMRGLYPSAG